MCDVMAGAPMSALDRKTHQIGAATVKVVVIQVVIFKFDSGRDERESM